MKLMYLLLLIFSFIVTIGGSIALTIFLVRRSNRVGIRVIVFTKDKKRTVTKFKRIEESFSIGKHKYLFDSNFIFKSRSRDYIYYNEGNTDPIDIKTGKGGDISSDKFKSLMDSKLIRELFTNKSDELFSPQMVIMYVILILNALILIILLVKGNGAVSIIGDVNKEFIKQAVLEAIR